MPNIDHVMPKPVIVPIFWGHDYVANPATSKSLGQMVSDLVTGPFINGVAQYGVERPSMVAPILIDDTNPPATLVWLDQNDNLEDQITPYLVGWINAGLVPPPPSPTDINQFYLIFPPPETTPQTYNGPKDPIGNGIQAWHNEGKIVVGSGPLYTIYYWAIFKTNDVGPATSLNFVSNVAAKVGHEIVEQVVDRNGTFQEIGDPCNNSTFNYRGWPVEPYWSVWDNRCIQGNQPVSLKQFLGVSGFDYHNQGLRKLGTARISIDYIAQWMQAANWA